MSTVISEFQVTRPVRPIRSARRLSSSSSSYLNIKRFLDLVFCSSLLILTSPLLLVVALLVKLQDGGPVFYRAKRVGKKGVPFFCYKFRTMVPNADAMKSDLLRRNIHGKGITFKVVDDPRITRLGRVMRRFSIDELPQLCNVLRGEMTLVGPRPACPQEVARYSSTDRDRLAVTPGLTCLWQVSGRCEIPFERQVELDRQYIQNQSLALDAVLILRTIPAVIFGKGAY